MISLKCLKEALTYSRKTGVFIWKNRNSIPKRTNSRYAGKVAGSVRADGYIIITIFGVRYYAQRLAWFYVTGEWPVQLIDHKDLDQGNNRFANLREAGKTQNGQNRKSQKNNVSGFKGVSRHSQTGKWVARIHDGAGQYKHLGCFNTAEEASSAYCAAAKRFHGVFARPV